ncbi:MAG TPA: hypothetical protein VMI06_10605 [Terriglobia bacterium]|nr:hypothetical protein [Terriglobia bacterium]
MTKQQKQRILWLAAIALAAVYFVPQVINTNRRAAAIRQQQAARLAKPPASKSAGPLPAPGATGPAAGASATGAPAAAALPADADLIFGIWQGAGPQPGLGMCNLRLELRRDAADPSRISGFPVLACAPIMSPFSRPSAAQTQSALMSGLSPMSAVLTGTVIDDDAVQFSVDKVMGNAPGGCSFTSFTVTPFGADLISAEWHEATCQGGDRRGQLLLKRMGR